MLFMIEAVVLEEDIQEIQKLHKLRNKYGKSRANRGSPKVKCELKNGHFF